MSAPKAPQPNRGVYSQSRPLPRVNEQTVPVPPFLSPGYFGFLREFLREPSSNPCFMREWRRSLRWTARFGMTPLVFGLVATFLATLLSLGVLYFIQDMNTPIMWQVPLVTAFFAPSAIASSLFFFRLYGLCRDLSDRVVLAELFLTRTHPQEMVFGFLLGATLPSSLLALCLLPGAGIIGLHLFIKTDGIRAIDSAAPMGLLLLFWPNVLSSMLAAGAIAAGSSFGVQAEGHPMARALTTWLLFSLCLSVPLIGLAIGSWPLTFLFGGPVLVVLRLAIAGGFLHHLALRIAQQADEA